jgi:hypothetical protein
MWTRERFFDTSRRHESGFAARFVATLGIFALVFAGSCVVTDKIEFEDWENRQISIERDTPASPSIQVAVDDSPGNNTFWTKFSVKVWDADVVDAEDSHIAARLIYQIDNWTDPDSSECGVPELDSEAKDGEGPPVFRITCSLNVGNTGMGVNNLLYVRLLVSDLGFLRGDPVRGATTAEMLWYVERLDTIE